METAIDGLGFRNFTMEINDVATAFMGRRISNSKPVCTGNRTL